MTKTKSINPYTSEVFDSFKNHTKADITDILKKADKRFYKWRETSFAERKKLMLNAASELKKNKQEYAKTITTEIGKPDQKAKAAYTGKDPLNMPVRRPQSRPYNLY